ncbi:MAG TPA: orotate phosphoribosyltransferase [Phycisphaerales bacterium]|nr:orotate phosphoribosyltransferase [Phycisphaerales bacterium]
MFWFCLECGFVKILLLMEMDMTRDELIKRVKETSYLEGDFTLRSGKKSKYYMDKYLFETCPDILKALGAEFAKHISDDVTLIAGAELGGVALAAATAMESGKNWIIVRNSKKGYGTSKMVEGALKEGDVVLLVEDIATTGGQVIEAAKIITDAGATVKEIVCVIDRKQGAEENITGAGYKFDSIMTKSDLGITD